MAMTEVFMLVETANDDNSYGLVNATVFGSAEEARERMKADFEQKLKELGGDVGDENSDADGTWISEDSAHITANGEMDHYDWEIRRSEIHIPGKNRKLKSYYVEVTIAGAICVDADSADAAEAMVSEGVKNDDAEIMEAISDMARNHIEYGSIDVGNAVEVDE